MVRAGAAVSGLAGGGGAAGAPIDPGLAAVGGLPWLAEPLAAALVQRRAHALLVHGPEGVGQFEFALALARAWLCEAPLVEVAPRLACGRCAGCRLVDSRSHPDLRLIVPEALRGMAGLASGEAEDAVGADAAARKRKPSREIKVDQIRAALDFSELSGSRASGLRVVVLHPAEQINAIAANALLKTLEEPAGDLRFILSCGAPAALLPTVRSRCQSVRLGLPPRAMGRTWLMSRLALDEHDADVLLDACGDQVLAAHALATAGLGAQAWRELPSQVARGDVAALAPWPLPELVLALQKLCADLTLLSLGAPPRHFPQQALAALSDGVREARGISTGARPNAAGVSPGTEVAKRHERVQRLTAWAAQLRRQSRSAEHPWSAALAIEALVIAARQATCAAADTLKP
jgi:DNA polymerase-3 subunit delta'